MGSGVALDALRSVECQLTNIFQRCCFVHQREVTMMIPPQHQSHTLMITPVIHSRSARLRYTFKLRICASAVSPKPECDTTESLVALNIAASSWICLQFVDGAEFDLGTIVPYANKARWK